jgi:hypothetical protein
LLATGWRAVACFALGMLPALHARAQSDVSSIEAATTVFHEAGGPLSMTVLVPEVNANVAFSDALSMRAGWNADVVSGASVAVVDAPAASVDAISSASVADVRHVFGGGLALRDDQSALLANYRYGFENDYRSHGFDVAARTDLFDRNTTAEIAYARSFDRACDAEGAEDPVLKGRLDSSDHCFEDDVENREVRDIDVHGLQLGITQTLTPVLVLQLGASAQIQHGFLANPYRAVLIGPTAAQEHHPENRARYAASLGLRWWLKPLSGALQPMLRVYRDTWHLRALSAELGYEQSFTPWLRLRLRGRIHVQSGAAFYSDDYVLAPRGRYFTGDRDLSPLKTLMGGAELTWSATPDDDGEVLGFLSAFDLKLKGDALQTMLDDFHYDRVEPPNDLALIASFSVLAQM